MEKTNRYNMGGIVLEIPLRWDEYSRKFVEDYSDFIKHPVRTPAGHPIFLTIHFHQPHGSLLGVCHNEKMRFKTQKPTKLGTYKEETT